MLSARKKNIMQTATTAIADTTTTTTIATTQSTGSTTATGQALWKQHALDTMDYYLYQCY